MGDGAGNGDEDQQGGDDGNTFTRPSFEPPTLSIETHREGAKRDTDGSTAMKEIGKDLVATGVSSSTEASQTEEKLRPVPASSRLEVDQGPSSKEILQSQNTQQSSDKASPSDAGLGSASFEIPPNKSETVQTGQPNILQSSQKEATNTSIKAKPSPPLTVAAAASSAGRPASPTTVSNTKTAPSSSISATTGAAPPTTEGDLSEFDLQNNALKKSTSIRSNTHGKKNTLPTKSKTPGSAKASASSASTGPHPSKKRKLAPTTQQRQIIQPQPHETQQQQHEHLSAELALVQGTVQNIINLLSSYGPLTAGQLEYNLPPIRLAEQGMSGEASLINIRLLDILQILVATGVVQQVVPPPVGSGTDEVAFNSANTMSTSKPNSLDQPNIPPARYCVNIGVPRPDESFPLPLALLQQTDSTHDEIRRSMERAKLLESLFTATSSTSSRSNHKDVMRQIAHKYPEILQDPVYVTAMRNLHVDLGNTRTASQTSEVTKTAASTKNPSTNRSAKRTQSSKSHSGSANRRTSTTRKPGTKTGGTSSKSSSVAQTVVDLSSSSTYPSSSEKHGATHLSVTAFGTTEIVHSFPLSTDAKLGPAGPEQPASADRANDGKQHQEVKTEAKQEVEKSSNSPDLSQRKTSFSGSAFPKGQPEG